MREIADETVELDGLEDILIKSLQKYVEMDEPEEDDMDIDAIQQELSGATDLEAALAADLMAANADEGGDAADDAAGDGAGDDGDGEGDEKAKDD